MRKGTTRLTRCAAASLAGLSLLAMAGCSDDDETISVYQPTMMGTPTGSTSTSPSTTASHTTTTTGATSSTSTRPAPLATKDANGLSVALASCQVSGGKALVNAVVTNQTTEASDLIIEVSVHEASGAAVDTVTLINRGVPAGGQVPLVGNGTKAVTEPLTCAIGQITRVPSAS